ncbi:MAG: hypothetical protein N5P05_002733 [Chroococcopsis gigantea SAG 12.99]|jgi:O-acetyl-ADP-ribose deacetylase (regulator of RNase III)|nr:hypothetical protein [Chroococcopsis gigantea SAG 12.99]
MSLEVIKGNLFSTRCQTLVNTVNCVGVMGAGIALEFRLRYPRMYERYQEICQQKLLDIGKLWIFKTDQRWILNFPTKKHWKDKSELNFLKLGLEKFIDNYQNKGIQSIAFPVLGSLNGGLPENESIAIMTEYLNKCTINVEIYIYDPNSADDIFERIKQSFISLPAQDIMKITGLKQPYFKKVKEAIEIGQVYSLSGLLSTKGIGIATVEKTLLILNQELEI